MRKFPLLRPPLLLSVALSIVGVVVASRFIGWPAAFVAVAIADFIHWLAAKK